MMSTFRSALAALALFALPAQADDGIHVENAYARASAQSGAVFMTIINQGATEDRLLSVSTDAAERAGLHTHSEDANGVMRMLEVAEGFPIPAKGTHELARGADHVMLMGLTRDLRNGDVLTLTLTFEHEGEVVVDVPVDNDRKTPDDAGAMTHSHTP